MNGNKKKLQQLGMPHGTASNRLKKMIMFRLLQEVGKDMCFQCGEKIESVEELSVEHKIPWLNSKNPVDLFFDLDNIAFSHLKCNARAARRHIKHTTDEERKIAQAGYLRNWRKRNPELDKQRRKDRYQRDKAIRKTDLTER